MILVQNRRIFLMPMKRMVIDVEGEFGVITGP